MNEYLMVFFLNYLQLIDREKKTYKRGISFDFFSLKHKETLKSKKRNYNTDIFSKFESSKEILVQTIQEKKESLYEAFFFHYLDRWALILAKPNTKSYYIKYFGTKEENADFKYSLEIQIQKHEELKNLKNLTQSK